MDHARNSARLVVEPKGKSVPMTKTTGLEPCADQTFKQIFPWDNDLDVQISEPTIHFLADYYNMTEHHFEIPDGEAEGRKYLLEINQHYAVKDTRDRLNVIDARWIDMSSGLFIDITAVRKDEMKESGWLMCKDRHTYEQDQIWPLRESYFEGVPAKIPYAYVELLKEEYGVRSLTNGDFHECVPPHPPQPPQFHGVIFMRRFCTNSP
jgi:phosphorylcholine metabolism protein LicD